MVWRVFTSTKANPPDQKQYFWWTVQGDICRPYLDPNYHDSSTAASRYLNAKFDHFAYEQITTKNASNGRDPLRDTCDQYLRRKHFVLSSLSDEEKSFPLAYSILVYKDYPQVEQLIRTIYRPEHTICVHVDVKASSQLLQQLQHLVECFPREVVFLSKRRLSVQWGKFSTLEADLICMAELWGLWPTRKWKYFINLTGQEYPLRTNLELVRILRQLNGSNAIEGLSQQQEFSRHPKTKLPFAVKWIKGAVHIVATNSFVNFSLHDTKALAILDLLKKEAQIPDELYFSTLNHNPQLGKLARKREEIEGLKGNSTNPVFSGDETTLKLQHRLSKAIEKQKELQNKIEKEYAKTKLLQSPSFTSPTISRPPSQPTEVSESSRFEKYMEMMLINQTNAQNMILNQMLLKSAQQPAAALVNPQPPPQPSNQSAAPMAPYPFMPPYPMMGPYSYPPVFPQTQSIPFQMPAAVLPSQPAATPVEISRQISSPKFPSPKSVKPVTPKLPKTQTNKQYPFPGNASQRRLRQIGFTALFCSLLDKEASTHKFKPDVTFLFSVKVKEVINAYHRLFLSENGEINLVFRNHLTSENTVPFVALMDSKLNSGERLATTQEVGFIIEKLTYQMSDILPTNGVLGTTKKAAVFDMITNGNRFPDNFFLGIDLEVIELDSGRRTINIGDSQAFLILLNAILIQSMVQTLLFRPRDHGVVGECSGKVLDNIRFIATLFVYIYRRILSILKAGGPLVKNGTQVPLVSEPIEYTGLIYSDQQMDQVYKTLEKSVQYCETVFMQWGEQYVSRLRRAA